MSLTERVREVVREQFDEGERDGVEALLATYGTEPCERETERVLLCVLKLARGDAGKVRELVACAKLDYRDVILWAEYPQESGLDTPERVRAFNAMLERFGAGFRVPEGEDG